MSSSSGQFDRKRFREVLSNYPTGVTVITAMGLDGHPVGMAVGSFTSVSLDPPLVAFFPEKTSTTFPRIREAGSFCVNVLSAAQEQHCRSFAARGNDKFQGIDWEPAGSGSPLLDGVVAWVDCDIESVVEAGDHYVVLGRVRALDVSSPSLPLVFFRGGYGRFSSSSLIAAHEPDLVQVVRYGSLARDEMERIAADLGLECTAAARVGPDLVVIASAGAPSPSSGPPMVGRRIPMAPPLGGQYMAWEPAEVVDEWLAGAPVTLTPEQRHDYDEALARVRNRGWLLYTSDMGFAEVDALAERMFREGDPGRSDEDMRRAICNLPIGFDAGEITMGRSYDVSRVIAPIFGPDGRVALTLNVLGPDTPCTYQELADIRDRLMDGADSLTALVGGKVPVNAAPRPG